MNGEFYDENILSGRDRDSILLQFQDSYEVSDQGSSSVGPRVETSNDNSPRPTNPTIFSLAYYQQYFNVNTEEVVQRIKGSLCPSLKVDYYEAKIKANPDLYGPMWVCVTLAFSIAIGSNMLDYFTRSGLELQKWRYGFHVITKALFVVFVYSWILPVLLWSILKWYLSSEINISALELICTYGYALTIYIPLSICWIIHIPYFQWILVILGATSSGIVLVSTMKPAINKGNYTIAAAILVLHMLFSIVIFFSFFHV